jgi:hypothetical protein
MAMKKSIGRTLARIDVSANTSVRIHEDFFNTHRDYHQLSHSATIHHHKCFWSEDRILRERAEGRVGRSVRDEDEVGRRKRFRSMFATSLLLSNLH